MWNKNLDHVSIGHFWCLSLMRTLCELQWVGLILKPAEQLPSWDFLFFVIHFSVQKELDSVQPGLMAQQAQVLAVNLDLHYILGSTWQKTISPSMFNLHICTMALRCAHMHTRWIYTHINIFKNEKNHQCPHRFCQFLKSMIACFAHKDSFFWLHVFEGVPRSSSKFGAEI